MNPCWETLGIRILGTRTNLLGTGWDSIRWEPLGTLEPCLPPAPRVEAAWVPPFNLGTFLGNPYFFTP